MAKENREFYLEREETFDLELTVRVININPDKHHELLDKCEILREYSQFVDVIRKYKDDKKRLQKAIGECIQKGF